jgi:LPXTG-motif cell wall-anchored protein
MRVAFVAQALLPFLVEAPPQAVLRWVARMKGRTSMDTNLLLLIVVLVLLFGGGGFYWSRRR